MSINVEIIGGSLMVQHYVETLARKDHLILDLTSDVFMPTGRTTIHVTWELSVRELGDGRCEFTNHVHSYGTEEFMTFLDRQGIPSSSFARSANPSGTSIARFSVNCGLARRSTLICRLSTKISASSEEASICFD